MRLQVLRLRFQREAVIEDGLVIEITSRVRRLGNEVEITNVTVLDAAEVSC
jgi:hypothetical protein